MPRHQLYDTTSRSAEAPSISPAFFRVCFPASAPETATTRNASAGEKRIGIAYEADNSASGRKKQKVYFGEDRQLLNSAARTIGTTLEAAN